MKRLFSVIMSLIMLLFLVAVSACSCNDTTVKDEKTFSSEEDAPKIIDGISVTDDGGSLTPSLNSKSNAPVNIAGTGAPSSQPSQKITVTEDMVIDCNGLNSPKNLFDEQSLDPTGDVSANIPVSPIPSIWSAWMQTFNNSLIVYLKAEYKVEKVYVYSRPWQTDNRTLTIKAGTPFSWSYSHTETFPNQGSVWTEIDVNVTTKYLYFECECNKAPYEIILWGKRTGAFDITPNRVYHAPKTIDELVGGCMNLADACVSGNDMANLTDEYLKPFSYLREYHNYGWTADSSGKFTPSLWGGYWDFDKLYKKLSESGFKTVPTIQGMTKDSESLNIGTNRAVTEVPASYSQIAKNVYQRAARYGTSGYNYLDGIEIGNELNNTWTNEYTYFTPIESAAMLSAAYDGHDGTLGSGYGIKTADSNMTVSMTGLAGINVNYIKAMALWSGFNRNYGTFPADAFNVHEYCTAKKGGKIVGVCPEEFNLIGEIEELLDYRDRYYPGIEVWLTEFGWDTAQSYSIETSAHEYGDYTGRELQAMWLVRTYLLLSATGIDRASMYMCNDTDPESSATMKYGTCGIKTVNKEKKDSYYYLYTLSSALKGYTFASRLNAGQDDLYVYKYIDSEGKVAYVLWCGTGNGSKFTNVTLNIGSASATKLEFKNGLNFGEASSLNVVNNSITLDVTERPVIIKTA